MLGGDGDQSFDGAWVTTGFTWSSTSTPDGGLRSALADPRPRFKHVRTPVVRVCTLEQVVDVAIFEIRVQMPNSNFALRPLDLVLIVFGRRRSLRRTAPVPDGPFRARDQHLEVDARGVE